MEEEEEEEGIQVSDDQEDQDRESMAQASKTHSDSDVGNEACEAGQLPCPRKRKAERSTSVIDYTTYFREYLRCLQFKEPQPVVDPKYVALQKALPNVNLMLHDRGFRGVCISMPDIKECMEFTKPDNENDQVSIVVKISSSPKFGVNDARDLKHKGNVKWLVVVTHEQVSIMAKKELQARCKHDGVTLSMFIVHELSRPYVRHELVPKHSEVPRDQEETLLKRLRCKKSQLPLMSDESAIARWYGWPIGTIVHCERRLGGYNQSKDMWRVVSPLPSNVSKKAQKKNQKNLH